MSQGDNDRGRSFLEGPAPLRPMTALPDESMICRRMRHRGQSRGWMIDQPLSPPPPSVTLTPHHHPHSLSCLSGNPLCTRPLSRPQVHTTETAGRTHSRAVYMIVGDQKASEGHRTGPPSVSSQEMGVTGGWGSALPEWRSAWGQPHHGTLGSSAQLSQGGFP